MCCCGLDGGPHLSRAALLGQVALFLSPQQHSRFQGGTNACALTLVTHTHTILPAGAPKTFNKIVAAHAVAAHASEVSLLQTNTQGPEQQLTRAHSTINTGGQPHMGVGSSTCAPETQMHATHTSHNMTLTSCTVHLSSCAAEAGRSWWTLPGEQPEEQQLTHSAPSAAGAAAASVVSNWLKLCRSLQGASP